MAWGSGDGGTGKTSRARSNLSSGVPGNRMPARGTARCVASAMTCASGTAQPVTSVRMVGASRVLAAAGCRTYITSVFTYEARCSLL